MERKDIISKIIEEHRKTIANLRQSVEEYKTASDLDEESTLDPEDFSNQTQAKDLQLRFEKILNEAEQNLAFLEDEQEAFHFDIEKGSLVETHKNIFFIGVSVSKFEFAGKEVISFSEDAPVFENLKNKTVGDVVTIGAIESKITAVF